jgi:hypothetical protein
MSKAVATIRWLWCMYRVRKLYKRGPFSARRMLMDDLRPWAHPDEPPSEGGLVIDYPDAIFFVQRHDVDRAEFRMSRRRGMRP